MSEDSKNISHQVKVADQSFTLRIGADEKPFYDRVAETTAATYKELCAQGLKPGESKTWAMTAFQIASEMTEARSGLEDLRQDQQRIKRLIERIETRLPKAKQTS